MEKVQNTPHLYKLINNLQTHINSVYTIGNTKISYISLWTSIIFIFFVIGVALLYGKPRKEQTKKYRNITTVFISIACGILFIFLNILSIGFSGFNNLQSYYSSIVISLKMILFIYLLLSYCVLPLIKYNKELDDTDRYNKLTRVIMIISNILIVIGMTYTMYLLLWYNDVYKKRQIFTMLIIICLAGGIAINNLIQDI